jgi:hypothetical protein
MTTGGQATPESPKDAVIAMIRSLPDDVTLEGILHELDFRRKVDGGLAQLDAGQGVEHAEAKDQFGRWTS